MDNSYNNTGLNHTSLDQSTTIVGGAGLNLSKGLLNWSNLVEKVTEDQQLDELGDLDHRELLQKICNVYHAVTEAPISMPD